MRAAPKVDQSHQEPAKVPIIDVFRARCEAKALLVAVGELTLHEAVDELQVSAVASGLVAEIGQDAAQRIMAIAFKTVPRP